MNEHVNDILLIGEDNLYLGTNTGLMLYFLNQKTKQAKFILRDRQIRKLYHTDDQRIWLISDRQGIESFNFHSGEITQYLHDPDKPGSILGDMVFSMLEDFSGNLWIGHPGEGLSILNLQQKAFNTFHYNPGLSNSISSNTIFSFNETNDMILIGTDYGGFDIMFKGNDREEHKFHHINNIIF